MVLRLQVTYQVVKDRIALLCAMETMRCLTGRNGLVEAKEQKPLWQKCRNIAFIDKFLILTIDRPPKEPYLKSGSSEGLRRASVAFGIPYMVVSCITLTLG